MVEQVSVVKVLGYGHYAHHIILITHHISHHSTLSTTETGRSESPRSRVRWLGDSRLGDSQRQLDHQTMDPRQDGGLSPRRDGGDVTPRRDGETHGPPKLRRKSLAQDWSQEGARRLGQIGSQLGIGQRCKIHMKVSLAGTSDPRIGEVMVKHHTYAAFRKLIGMLRIDCSGKQDRPVT